MTYYYCILFFIFFSYLILTDNSVAYAFDLVSRLVKFQFEKIKWIILNDPANPIVKYLIYRRSLKLAKELEKEFAKRKQLD